MSPPVQDLPLVLVTVGNDDGEFESLYRHLEQLSGDDEPNFQSLIVARREVPDVLYAALRSKARKLPHVHIRRLGDKIENCERLRHQSGTFIVPQSRKKRSGTSTA